MQPSDFKLKSDEIPKYFLFMHPIFALIGLVSLVLSVLLCYTILLPFMLSPIFSLPFHPYEFILILLTGSVFIIWLLTLFIYSYGTLEEYKIMETGKITFNSKDKIFNSLLIILIFLLFFQESLYSFFPDYNPIIQFLTYGFILFLVTVMSCAFLIKNMPWFAKKGWYFESEFDNQKEK